jgi:signal transduction histidine kinase
MMRRRLYLQIHAALVATLLVFASCASLAWLWLEAPAGRVWSWEHLALHWLLPLGIMFLLLSIAAYPVARRITRRLERLRARVEALGRGDLAARVEVEGEDEVAALARSFNDAAQRIERLMAAQRRLLAAASHELRSPIARVRLAAEMLTAREPPDATARRELRARLARDVQELDDLIDELLLASRLESRAAAPRREEVDLLGLLAEEAAALGAPTEVGGQPVRIAGDPRLLRRLVRNLLENAGRYGGGAPIEASTAALHPAGARLRVADRGPGVPEAERERIFEPFYRLAGEAQDALGGVGVGLGLALVREIARQHGGEVRCLAREGGGTCFEVDLEALHTTSPSRRTPETDAL